MDVRPLRVRLRARGRVQGVWFRGAAREKALSLGLSGWVRNLPDGSVEALAQGPAWAVEEFVAWCRRGPSGARVDSLDRRDESPGDELDEFDVVA
ncbi:acylphosphatase [bacterium]|nr:acylphosphatase [bacterium]